MKRIVYPLVLMLLMAACKNEKTSPENTEPTNGASAEEVAEGFGSPEFITKYNQYIRFGNLFHDRANNSYSRYLKWVDVEAGPSGNRVFGLYSLDSDYIDELDKAIDSKPTIEGVDKLMKEVSKTAKSLAKVNNEAYTYYDRENYKDDDFAKGQELHPQLMTAFDNYFLAYSTMYDSFEKTQRELFEHDLAKLKEEDRMIHYHLLKNIDQAEQIINLIRHQQSDIKTLDLTAFDQLTTQFKGSLENLDNTAKDKAQMEKFGGSSWLNSYISDAGDMIVECRNLKERIETNNFKYSITHPSIPDRGSPEKLAKIYDEMVGDYNRMM